MKFGVVVFPGSSGEEDCFYVIKNILNKEADFIWHKDYIKDIDTYNCIILPGGSSYGDYLRPGAIAGNSPVMESIKEFAGRGGLVLGICNGFQILLESGLLPGALLQNKNLRFKCQNTYIRVENDNTPFTGYCSKGQVLNIAMAHGYGRYYAPKDVIKNLKDNGQIIFRYCNEQGKIETDANPNGSIENIAGISNIKGNVFGTMIHPERSSEEVLNSSQGKAIFDSIIRYLKGGTTNGR
jgi:phosphoribosylformylglycinamidine synthase I